MANYSVTTYTYGPATLSEVAAALETRIETIDTGKTIRLYAVNPISRDRDLCVGILVYDT